MNSVDGINGTFRLNFIFAESYLLPYSHEWKNQAYAGGLKKIRTKRQGSRERKRG
jgi:hypothetical protein